MNNIEAFNLALMNKWRWNCVNDLNESWRPLLVYRYSDLRKLFKVNPYPRGGPKDSLWWRDLLLLEENFLNRQNLFHFAVRPVLGDGSHIYFWHNMWPGNETLKDLLPSLFMPAKREGRGC